MQHLHNAPEAARWLRSRVKGELRTDSRLVQEGDGFIAWPGAATDGRRYVAQALAQGAAACLLEEVGHASWLAGLQASQADGKLACMTGLKAQTGWVADAYYEQPSQALKVLAVTGTNGKTSTAWWLAQALSSTTLRQDCGLVGTLGVGQLPHLVSTGMTTPDPVLLQRQFRAFADAGVTHCAIEASSIGLAEHRLDGTRIGVAVFTNFTQDHLDYHGDMAAYWSAKAALFDWSGLQAAVINIDDAHGAMLARQLEGGDLQVWTCTKHSIGHSQARLQARVLPSAEGLAFEVIEGADVQVLHTHLMGDYNIDNLLGVIGSLRALGFELRAAVGACAQLTAVPGRMQRVIVDMANADAQGNMKLPLVLVDYAHTPDALAHALAALRSQAKLRGGRLWCVFGCGGDRDASKRPLMAAAAEAAADQLVLTSDNPRSESPEAIFAEMAAGLRLPQQAHVLIDRAEAIAQTIAQAAVEDVVLVAGKGHETAQEIMGVSHPFSDVVQVRMALRQRATMLQGAVA
jgi:UDP-N-acetylmuramoyl-L-alanyl-D-glutamate--2,6-diaminopimelate ligase